MKKALIVFALVAGWLNCAHAEKDPWELERERKERLEYYKNLPNPNDTHLLMPKDVRARKSLEDEEKDRQLEIPEALQYGVEPVDPHDSTAPRFEDLKAEDIRLPATKPVVDDGSGPPQIDRLVSKGIRFTITNPQPATAGQAIPILFTLTKPQTRAPVTLGELKAVRTKRLHLFVADPTFTDFQHLVPLPAGSLGTYQASFTPKLSGSYRVWAEITPEFEGKRQVAYADLGAPVPKVDMYVSDTVFAEDMTFRLLFDAPLKVGRNSIATLEVTTRDGAAYTKLEPVMDAFAYAIGVYDDFTTLLPTQLEGAELRDTSQRGGPKVKFYVNPDKPGMVRLFIQLKMDGRDRFVPFDVTVTPAGNVP